MAVIVQVGPVTAEAGGRPWCHPGDAGIESIQNARVVGSVKTSTQILKERLRGEAMYMARSES
jgi:hypothetical protein